MKNTLHSNIKIRDESNNNQSLYIKLIFIPIYSLLETEINYFLHYTGYEFNETERQKSLYKVFFTLTFIYMIQNLDFF